MIISIIAAVADNQVIGKKNSLPWYLPADLRHFKKLTTGHAIIMGKNTFNSIGKVLPDRLNIVLTTDKKLKENGYRIAHSLSEGLEIAAENNESEVFVIGGESVYKQAINLAHKLYITKIHNDFKGDVFFPKVSKHNWQLENCESHAPDKDNPYPYEFCVYKKKQ